MQGIGVWWPSGPLQNNLAHEPKGSSPDDLQADAPNHKLGEVYPTEDKFVHYLNECETICREMLALADRCDRVPALRTDDPIYKDRGRTSEARNLRQLATGRKSGRGGDEGLRRSALHEAVRQWRTERYPDYPYDTAENYVTMALEDRDSSLVELFGRITRWITAEAEDVTREHILSVCRSEVPWRDYKFRQSKTCLRFSLNLFPHNRVIHGRVAGGVRAIAGLIAQMTNGCVEWIESAMRTAIMGAIDDKALGKKIPVGRDTVIEAVKFYKNGHMDIWFTTEAITEAIQNTIHPKAPGDHHRFKRIYIKGGAANYEKCQVCGLVRRAPEQMIATLFQRDLAGRLRDRRARRSNPAPTEHRQRQREVQIERKKLWA